MIEIDLASLPVDHELRNKPLLGMFYYSKTSKVRNEIMPAFGIANKTYNQLGASWTAWDRFVYVNPEQS